MKCTIAQNQRLRVIVHLVDPNTKREMFQTIACTSMKNMFYKNNNNSVHCYIARQYALRTFTPMLITFFVLS